MKPLMREEKGQALVELSATALILCVMACGLVDVARALYYSEVLNTVAGEACSLASRGTNPTSVSQSAIGYAGSTLDLGQDGCVIVTVITNMGGTLEVTDQNSRCAVTASSRVGCVEGVAGCRTSTPTIPDEAVSALQAQPSGSSMYVTEIYYDFTAVSSLPKLMKDGPLPSQLYTIAYF